MLYDYDLYPPLDRESRTSRKKSRCKEFHPNSGTFLVPEGKFTLARNLPISLMVALAIIPKYCFAFLPLPRRQSSKC